MKYSLALFLLLAACGNPTLSCLATPNDVATVVRVESNTVKLRMRNGATRICVVAEYRAKMLAPGDILQGPLDDTYYWRADP